MLTVNILYILLRDVSTKNSGFCFYTFINNKSASLVVQKKEKKVLILTGKDSKIFYHIRLTLGKDKMVLEGKIFSPFLPRRAEYASITAFLVFDGAKILLLQNCFAPEIELFFADFAYERSRNTVVFQ